MQGALLLFETGIGRDVLRLGSGRRGIWACTPGVSETLYMEENFGLIFRSLFCPRAQISLFLQSSPPHTGRRPYKGLLLGRKTYLHMCVCVHMYVCLHVCIYLSTCAYACGAAAIC